jgi:hypothetical protein
VPVIDAIWPGSPMTPGASGAGEQHRLDVAFGDGTVTFHRLPSDRTG